tara:strand:- start:4981 stop:5409 length:429 start_codon:yes stop_codon:yes gene_type:complete
MNKQQKKERLEKIKELHFIRKMTLADTADILNVSLKTVHRYALKIREEMVSQVKEINLDKYISERLLEYHKIIENWWRIYDSSQDEKLKNSVLNNVHKAQCDFTDEMQRLGALPKQVERIEAQIDIGRMLDKISKFRKKKNE